MKTGYGAYKKEKDAYFEKVRRFCKTNSQCPDAGSIIRFLVGDGFSEYMIHDYETLLFVGDDEAYQIDDAHMRGLTADDIRARIE